MDLASPAVQLTYQVPSCQGEQPDVGKALNMLFGIYLFGQCIANALQCLELYIYLAIPVVSPTKRELESQATEWTLDQEDGDDGHDGGDDGGDGSDDGGKNHLGTLSPMALSKHFMAAPMAVTNW